MFRQSILSNLFFLAVAFLLCQRASADSILDLEEVKKHRNIGESHRLQGRNQEAIAALSKSLELRPDARTHLARARAWQALRDYNRTISDLDVAIEIDPKLTIAYAWRGSCRAKTDDTNKAIADYTTAISLAPNHPAVYSARAVVWENLDNHHLAISDMKKAIELSPDTASFYMLRALSWSSLCNWNNALEDLDKALEIAPDDLRYYAMRGETKRKSGDYSGALVDYEHALELDPRSPMTLRLFASFLSTCSSEDMRDYKKSVDLAKTLCEVTEWKVCHDVGLLAMIHTVSGNETEAAMWRDMAIQLAPRERKEWVRQRFAKLEAKNKKASR